MRKLLILTIVLALFSSCTTEFNRVYKSPDYRFKYEYAKECYANGKYTRAITLLQEVVTALKGTENGQECLYMLSMAEYNNKDYATAAEYFKKYYSSYPRGTYAEQAKFYAGKSLYMCTPEPRLDQTDTYEAIKVFQEFLDLFPTSAKRDEAQSRLFELQEKLVRKELYSAQLYYNLGGYFLNSLHGGNNYEACIITAQNALKDFPYTDRREDFALLIMKSKFELAQQSVEERKLERFQDAEDECYGFINEFPDSQNKALAEKYIAKCKVYTKSGTEVTKE